MNPVITTRLFIGASTLLAALSLAGGMLIILGGDDINIGGDVAQYSIGSLVALAGPLILAGAWLGRRKPFFGATCQVGGVAIFGVCFSWTIVGPSLALLVAALSVRRAQRFSREHAQHELIP
ncbi:MAG: hypothetical protein HY533_04820 [Chloroflexi bacterium]|nr:hypothetical protein [Chloroflexota bacterium]